MPFTKKGEATKLDFLKRFPSTIAPDSRKKIIFLIVNHSTIWGNKQHQAFIHAFKEDYKSEASAPASAELFISTAKSSDIIFVLNAGTVDKPCNRETTANNLKEFATNGGTVIFGGVPYGFNTDNSTNTAVFQNFGLNWVVGGTKDGWTKRESDISTTAMPQIRNRYNATFLKNVVEPWGCYVDCKPGKGKKPAKNAHAAVVYERFGAGAMAYVGLNDLTCHDSIELFKHLCVGAFKDDLTNPLWERLMKG